MNAWRVLFLTKLQLVVRWLGSETQNLLIRLIDHRGQTMIQVLPFVRIARIGGHATQGKCARVFCSPFCFSPKVETTCSFDHFMIAASERACVVCWFRNCHALHRDKRKLKRDQMWVSFDLKHRGALCFDYLSTSRMEKRNICLKVICSLILMAINYLSLITAG